MKKGTVVFLSFLLFLMSLVGGYEIIQSTKENIVTIRSPSGYELWSFNSEKKEFQKVWANLIYADRDYYSKNWEEGSLRNDLTLPVIVDIDGDSENELITCDKFGITIYGKNPMYYPFPISSQSVYSHILVEDINNDGRIEIVTHRGLPNEENAQAQRYELTIFQIEGNRLKIIWQKTMVSTRINWVLISGDVDNDGEKELITSYDFIKIWKQVNNNDWEIVAELPNKAYAVDVVRIADVNADGENEILATGNGSVLTIYKHRTDRSFGKSIYPVIWQSEDLTTEGLRPSREGGPEPAAYTQGLSVGDLDGDGKKEILVGTTESGIFPSEVERGNGGKIYIFKHAKKDIFKNVWTSKKTLGASIPAFAVGNIDNDDINEFIYNGQDVYKFTGQTSQYEKIGSLFSGVRTNAVIGNISTPIEPVDEIRIVPIKFDFWKMDLKLGQTYNTTVSWKNIWAEAENVSFNIHSDNDYVTIKDGHQKIGNMKRGEIVNSKSISIRIDEKKPKTEKDYIFLVIWFDISADGGYRQSIPFKFMVEFSE